MLLGNQFFRKNIFAPPKLKGFLRLARGTCRFLEKRQLSCSGCAVFGSHEMPPLEQRSSTTREASLAPSAVSACGPTKANGDKTSARDPGWVPSIKLRFRCNFGEKWHAEKSEVTFYIGISEYLPTFTNLLTFMNPPERNWKCCSLWNRPGVWKYSQPWCHGHGRQNQPRTPEKPWPSAGHWTKLFDTKMVSHQSHPMAWFNTIKIIRPNLWDSFKRNNLNHPVLRC